MERTALDVPLAPQTFAEPRERLFASHLTLYICVVLVSALASYAVWVRTRSIFSCPATGYSADRYLAYCAGANYGGASMTHGAVRAPQRSPRPRARVIFVLIPVSSMKTSLCGSVRMLGCRSAFHASRAWHTSGRSHSLA